MSDPQNLPSPPVPPPSSMGIVELDAFASKSANTFQGTRALEILEEIVGADVLEYRDPKKAAVFAADVLRMAALASIEGNPNFMKSAANVLRLQARSHGVQIARNVEDKFGERISAVMSLFRDLLPLFL
jgi:hypothetical protein